ncbi:MAG: NADH-quinone oxidoreductase subunit NuoI [Acidimicrobiia bacterium]
MSAAAIARGLGVTLKNLFRRKITTPYPEAIRPKPPRFHGRHVLNRYEDGMEKCIGCELCAGVCPARCIYVRGADNPPDAPVSPGERFGYVYEINFLRCIFCGLCVEACPTEAITMSNLFEWSFTDRSDAIFGKDILLVEPDGTPKHTGSPYHDPESLRESGGWMRATSPAGNADYEGVVGWSSDAGYGVRPGEAGQRGLDLAEAAAGGSGWSSPDDGGAPGDAADPRSDENEEHA